jgi:hypothetical protein
MMRPKQAVSANRSSLNSTMQRTTKNDSPDDVCLSTDQPEPSTHQNSTALSTMPSSSIIERFSAVPDRILSSTLKGMTSMQINDSH